MSYEKNKRMSCADIEKMSAGEFPAKKSQWLIIMT